MRDSEFGVRGPGSGVRIRVSRIRIPYPASRTPCPVLLPPPTRHRARGEQPVESGNEQFISAAQQAPENTWDGKGGIQVVTQVVAVTRPEARGVMIVKRPGSQRQKGRKKWYPDGEQSRASYRRISPPPPCVQPSHGQQNDGGFLAEDRQGSGKGEEPELFAEEKQNGQYGEQSGGQIQVSQGGLGKEERGNRQKQRAPNRDLTCANATAQRIEGCHRRRRNQRHRRAGRPNRTPEEMPHKPEIHRDQWGVPGGQRGGRYQ